MRSDGLFRLASQLGKHLHEVLGWAPYLTHRQSCGWQLWLAEQWNRPSLTDHYLAQLAQFLWSIPAWFWGKKADTNLKDFLLKFTRPKGMVGKVPAKIVDNWAKQKWLAAVGYKPETKNG